MQVQKLCTYKIINTRAYHATARSSFLTRWNRGWMRKFCTQNLFSARPSFLRSTVCSSGVFQFFVAGAGGAWVAVLTLSDAMYTAVYISILCFFTKTNTKTESFHKFSILLYPSSNNEEFSTMASKRTTTVNKQAAELFQLFLLTFSHDLWP